jgi:hypothetical protein
MNNLRLGNRRKGSINQILELKRWLDIFTITSKITFPLGK